MTYLLSLDQANSVLSSEEQRELEQLLSTYAEADGTSLCRGRLNFLIENGIKIKIIRPSDAGPISYDVGGHATKTNIELTVPFGRISKVADIAQTLIFEIGNVISSNSVERRALRRKLDRGEIGPMEYGRQIARGEAENAWQFTSSLEVLNHKNYAISSQSMKYIKSKFGKDKEEYIEFFNSTAHEKERAGIKGLRSDRRYAFETLTTHFPSARTAKLLSNALNDPGWAYKAFIDDATGNFGDDEAAAVYGTIIDIIGHVPAWQQSLKRDYALAYDMHAVAQTIRLKSGTRDKIRKAFLETADSLEDMDADKARRLLDGIHWLRA